MDGYVRNGYTRKQLGDLSPSPTNLSLLRLDNNEVCVIRCSGLLYVCCDRVFVNNASTLRASPADTQKCLVRNFWRGAVDKMYPCPCSVPHCTTMWAGTRRDTALVCVVVYQPQRLAHRHVSL